LTYSNNDRTSDTVISSNRRSPQTATISFQEERYDSLDGTGTVSATTGTISAKVGTCHPVDTTPSSGTIRPATDRRAGPATGLTGGHRTDSSHQSAGIRQRLIQPLLAEDQQSR
jgi:hypothetical protein